MAFATSATWLIRRWGTLRLACSRYSQPYSQSVSSDFASGYTSFVQLVYFAVLIVLFIQLFSGLQVGIDIPSTSKCRQLKQTVY